MHFPNQQILFRLQMKKWIQWGSEIRPSLDYQWSYRGWVANGLNFEWDLGHIIWSFPESSKSRSPTIWNPDKWPSFFQKPFEIRTKMSGFWVVRFLSGWDYNYSHAKARPLKNWTIWNPTFKISRFQIVPDFKWWDFRSPLYSIRVHFLFRLEF